MSGKEQLICLKKAYCQHSLYFHVRPYGGLGVVGTSGFYSPTYLSRQDLLF